MQERSSRGAFTTQPAGTRAEPCEAATPRQQRLLPPPLPNLIIKSHCPAADRLGFFFYCFLLQDTKETVNNTASGHKA